MEFETFNLDLIINVLLRSLLSPAFAMWVPIVTWSQGYRYGSLELFRTLDYFYICLAISLWSWADSVWRNKPWRNKNSTGVLSLLFGQKDMINWENEIVVVTGAASGIGNSIIETLAVRNVCVVALDIKPVQSQYDISYYECDISNKKEVALVAKKIVEEIGNPTILINNAGVVNGKSILDLSEGEIKKTFDVNVLAHFWTVKEFLPYMISQNHGHIVTVASTLSSMGVANLSDYCASKAAIASFHETLSHEIGHIYKSPGVRSTIVNPGHVPTSLFKDLDRPKSLLVRFLCPYVSTHDIAKAIITALDNHESKYIFMPHYTRLAWILKGLPSWLCSFAYWISGANQAMDRYSNSKKDD